MADIGDAVFHDDLAAALAIDKRDLADPFDLRHFASPANE
jgi:hypothetical protein